MRGLDLLPGSSCVHVIWLTHDGSDVDIPKRFVPFWESAKRVFPSREHVVWRDQDARAMVCKWGNEAFFYDTLRTPLERSDVLRMMILYDFGGIYVDVDMEFKETPPLLSDRPVNLLRSPLFSEEFQSCLLVANTVNHWLWKDCVVNIERNFSNLQERKEASVVKMLLANPITSRITRMVLTVFMTGPPNIDRAIAARFDDCYGQIGILPDTCYEGPIAIHHEAGSWTIFPALAHLRDSCISVARLLFGMLISMPTCVYVIMFALRGFYVRPPLVP